MQIDLDSFIVWLLTQLDTVFYCGHCTGIAAFDLMKQIMGDKLIALHSGESVN